MTRKRWDGRGPVLALMLTLAPAGAAPALAQTPSAPTLRDEAVWPALSVRGQVTATGSWRWSADTLARSRDGVNTLDSLFEPTRLSLRTVLEERSISRRESLLLRAREQVKVAWPLVSGGRLTGIVSDEVLVQADAQRMSTPVLDGNHLFVGVWRRLTPRSAMELGYVNVLARAGSHGRRRSHVLSLSLAATVERRPR